MVVRYRPPARWLAYDIVAIAAELTDAKAAIMALAEMPYQRAWADRLQAIELKREIAGTSRIEGAEFTERELDEALSESPPEARLTRSQRQARAAGMTYKWIAALPEDRPVDEALILEIHRRIVTGCDDDHCQPGRLRGAGENVSFGAPVHRGAEGGAECAAAFAALCAALGRDFRAHDPLVQALALHYHIGAMHPFQDGNGRTARAVEALMLRRSRLKDTLFVAMSNHYYDEKPRYLAALAAAASQGHDLTPFLKFALAGIALQCRRLLAEIRVHVQKALFRDVMATMYGSLRSTRKRAMGKRQCEILDRLLKRDAPVDRVTLYDDVRREYANLGHADRAFIRDLFDLEALGAISLTPGSDGAPILVAARLGWATEITETAFYREINRLPSAKTRLRLTAGGSRA